MLMRSPLACERRLPPGFIPPALLKPATTVPTGPGWIHELKHDGIRLIARKDGGRVCLWSRHGRNRTGDFAAIAAALREFPVDLVLDGEAVAHCEAGLPDFHRTLSREGQRTACLLAFDLLVIDGEDLRALPLLARRAPGGATRWHSAGAPFLRAHGRPARGGHVPARLRDEP
jgi:bifunctional non-homologous end joining protein LigD